MKTATVEHVVDLGALPELTEAERAELVGLQDLSDEEIDRSDIPALSEEAWRRAVPNTLIRTLRASTAVRVDDDILAWFKAQGGGYEARINAVLRRVMVEETASGPD
jgi:uncharacterized protein (DUF4415 family)